MALRAARPSTRHARRALRAGIVTTLAVGAAGLSFAAPPAEDDHAPNRILLMPRAGLPAAELGKLVGVHGGKARRIGGSDLHIVDLPPNASPKAVAAQLAHHPHVKFAELDRRVPHDLVANDPYAGSQWHLPQIGVPQAWDSSQGSGITIAILDTGVDATHPDLAARMVAGWNFYDNNSNSADVYGHGTKVAGSAAAIGNNAVGVAGVAAQARIMPIRISDASGYGYWSMVAQGLTWAADRGARVANVSYSVAGSASVQSAAQYMKNKGGLVVVSAGNNGVNENVARTTTMIPVSATNRSDVRTSWSSWGDFVAVAAPGESIYTTVKGGGYGAVSGTSFASPVTAGVVALMMAARPALSSTEVESALFASARDIGTAGRDAYYGWGRVDAAAAVQAAMGAQPVGDSQAPTVAVTDPAAGATVSGVATVNVGASDNVGVARVELRVNGATVAVDSTAPFGFAWDTTKHGNGMAELRAHAFDAAGNSAASTAVSVNVANQAVAADTTPPVVKLLNPAAGSRVSGTVSVNVSASDNAGTAGLTQTLYLDGRVVATASGGSLAYKWNTRKVAAGSHTLQAVARDAAGNSASVSVQVTR